MVRKLAAIFLIVLTIGSGSIAGAWTDTERSTTAYTGTDAQLMEGGGDGNTHLFIIQEAVKLLQTHPNRNYQMVGNAIAAHMNAVNTLKGSEILTGNILADNPPSWLKGVDELGLEGLDRLGSYSYAITYDASVRPTHWYNAYSIPYLNHFYNPYGQVQGGTWTDHADHSAKDMVELWTLQSRRSFETAAQLNAGACNGTSANNVIYEAAYSKGAVSPEADAPAWSNEKLWANITCGDVTGTSAQFFESHGWELLGATLHFVADPGQPYHAIQMGTTDSDPYDLHGFSERYANAVQSCFAFDEAARASCPDSSLLRTGADREPAYDPDKKLTDYVEHLAKSSFRLAGSVTGTLDINKMWTSKVKSLWYLAAGVGKSPLSGMDGKVCSEWVDGNHNLTIPIETVWDRVDQTRYWSCKWVGFTENQRTGFRNELMKEIGGALGDALEETIRTTAGFLVSWYYYTGLGNGQPTASGLTISNPKVSPTADGAIVEWDTPTATDAWVVVRDGASNHTGSVLQRFGHELVPGSGTHHKVEVTKLQSGHTYSLELRSADKAQDAFLFRDLTPRIGDLYIINPRVESRTSTSMTIKWETNRPASTRYMVENDGVERWPDELYTKDHTITLTGLSPSMKYRVELRSWDGQKYASWSYTAWTLDPEAELTMSNEKVVSSGTRATVTWTTNKPATSRVTLHGDSVREFSTEGVTTDHSVQLDGLVPGTIYFVQIHTAADGGEQTRLLPLSVAEQLSISDERIMNATATMAVMAWRTNREADSYVKINDQTWGQPGNFLEHYVVLTGLEPGQWYQATITSSDGNATATDLYTFHTDGTPPPSLTISNKQVSGVTDTTATITWSTNRSANSWLVVNGSDYGANDSNTYHQVTVTGLQPGTTYSAQVRSGDGSQMATENITFATAAAQVRLEITSETVTNVTATSATITWWTPAVANSFVTVNGQTFGQDDRTTSHSVTVTGLEPGKWYQAELRSGSGLQVATDLYSFTTQNAPPPSLTISNKQVAGVTDTTATVTVTWFTNRPANSRLVVNGQDYGTNASSSYHKVTVTGLLPGTTYSAQIRSGDGTEVATDTIGFTTDVAAPHLEIFSETATNVMETSATLTWQTTVAANSFVTVNGRMFGQDDRTTSHSVTVTGLEAGKRYQAELRSGDGQKTVTDLYSFSTRNAPPPSLTISAKRVASATDTTVTITWFTNHSANSWLVVNGRDYGANDSTTHHEVTVTGLQPGTNYTAQIRSGDGTQVATDSISFATGAGLTMTNVRAGIIYTDSAVIIWNTNLPSTSWVDVGGRRFGSSTLSTVHRVNIEGLTKGTHYLLWVYSETGTAQGSATVEFTTPLKNL